MAVRKLINSNVFWYVFLSLAFAIVMMFFLMAFFDLPVLLPVLSILGYLLVVLLRLKMQFYEHWKNDENAYAMKRQFTYLLVIPFLIYLIVNEFETKNRITVLLVYFVPSLVIVLHSVYLTLLKGDYYNS